MYKLIRPLLFLFDPEAVHHFTFALLRIVGNVPGFHQIARSLFGFEHPALAKQLLGLQFRNPVGLAAGFDKDARLIDELSCFGFGFIEIGTLTPKPQAGNDRPRLFRLPRDKAIINRMGFNNEGVLMAVQQLKKRKSSVIVGGNIGRNKSTPNDKAFEEYNYCVEALYPYVDYFVVNVSSPNTPGLRELQEREPLKKLLNHVRKLVSLKEKNKPVLLKIAPDLSVGQLDDVIEILKETGTDGVIATNTTVSRDELTATEEVLKKIGPGGVSGEPIRRKSTQIISYLRKQMGPEYPIIGVGGILSPEDALEKIRAGADLVQLYTGFVYEGPGFVKRINKRIVEEKLNAQIVQHID
jgi:dihydroorotate dehydrogenase